MPRNQKYGSISSQIYNFIQRNLKVEERNKSFANLDLCFLNDYKRFNGKMLNVDSYYDTLKLDTRKSKKILVEEIEKLKDVLRKVEQAAHLVQFLNGFFNSTPFDIDLDFRYKDVNVRSQITERIEVVRWLYTGALFEVCIQLKNFLSLGDVVAYRQNIEQNAGQLSDYFKDRAGRHNVFPQEFNLFIYETIQSFRQNYQGRNEDREARILNLKLSRQLMYTNRLMARLERNIHKRWNPQGNNNDFLANAIYVDCVQRVFDNFASTRSEVFSKLRILTDTVALGVSKTSVRLFSAFQQYSSLVISLMSITEDDHIWLNENQIIGEIDRTHLQINRLIANLQNEERECKVWLMDELSDSQNNNALIGARVHPNDKIDFIYGMKNNKSVNQLLHFKGGQINHKQVYYWKSIYEDSVPTSLRPPPPAPPAQGGGGGGGGGGAPTGPLARPTVPLPGPPPAPPARVPPRPATPPPASPASPTSSSPTTTNSAPSTPERAPAGPSPGQPSPQKPPGLTIEGASEADRRGEEIARRQRQEKEEREKRIREALEEAEKRRRAEEQAKIDAQDELESREFARKQREEQERKQNEEQIERLFVNLKQFYNDYWTADEKDIENDKEYATAEIRETKKNIINLGMSNQKLTERISKISREEREKVQALKTQRRDEERRQRSAARKAAQKKMLEEQAAERKKKREERLARQAEEAKRIAEAEREAELTEEEKQYIKQSVQDEYDKKKVRTLALEWSKWEDKLIGFYVRDETGKPIEPEKFDNTKKLNEAELKLAENLVKRANLLEAECTKLGVCQAQKILELKEKKARLENWLSSIKQKKVDNAAAAAAKEKAAQEEADRLAREKAAQEEVERQRAEQVRADQQLAQRLNTELNPPPVQNVQLPEGDYIQIDQQLIAMSEVPRPINVGGAGLNCMFYSLIRAFHNFTVEDKAFDNKNLKYYADELRRLLRENFCSMARLKNIDKISVVTGEVVLPAGRVFKDWCDNLKDGKTVDSNFFAVIAFILGVNIRIYQVPGRGNIRLNPQVMVIYHNQNARDEPVALEFYFDNDHFRYYPSPAFRNQNLLQVLNERMARLFGSENVYLTPTRIVGQLSNLVRILQPDMPESTYNRNALRNLRSTAVTPPRNQNLVIDLSKSPVNLDRERPSTPEPEKRQKIFEEEIRKENKDMKADKGDTMSISSDSTAETIPQDLSPVKDLQNEALKDQKEKLEKYASELLNQNARLRRSNNMLRTESGTLRQQLDKANEEKQQIIQQAYEDKEQLVQQAKIAVEDTRRQAQRQAQRDKEEIEQKAKKIIDQVGKQANENQSNLERQLMYTKLEEQKAVLAKEAAEQKAKSEAQKSQDAQAAKQQAEAAKQQAEAEKKQAQDANTFLQQQLANKSTETAQERLRATAAEQKLEVQQAIAKQAQSAENQAEGEKYRAQGAAMRTAVENEQLQNENEQLKIEIQNLNRDVTNLARTLQNEIFKKTYVSKKLDETRKKKTSIDQINAVLKGTLQDVQTQFDTLQEQVKRKQEEREQTNTQIIEEIVQQNKKISDLVEENEELQKKIKEKDTTFDWAGSIARNKKEIEKRQLQKQGALQTQARKEKELKKLQEEYVKKNAELQKLKEEVNEFEKIRDEFQSKTDVPPTLDIQNNFDNDVEKFIGVIDNNLSEVNEQANRQEEAKEDLSLAHEQETRASLSFAEQLNAYRMNQNEKFETLQVAKEVMEAKSESADKENAYIQETKRSVIMLAATQRLRERYLKEKKTKEATELQTLEDNLRKALGENYKKYLNRKRRSTRYQGDYVGQGGGKRDLQSEKSGTEPTPKFGFVPTVKRSEGRQLVRNNSKRSRIKSKFNVKIEDDGIVILGNLQAFS